MAQIYEINGKLADMLIPELIRTGKIMSIDCLEIHTGEGQMSTTETGQIWLTAAYFPQTAGDDGTHAYAVLQFLLIITFVCLGVHLKAHQISEMH